LQSYLNERNDVSLICHEHKNKNNIYIYLNMNLTILELISK
jgi:hypothetical protein